MDDAPRVQELVEHLFRHQAGQMLATLTQILGVENLDWKEWITARPVSVSSPTVARTSSVSRLDSAA